MHIRIHVDEVIKMRIIHSAYNFCCARKLQNRASQQNATLSSNETNKTDKDPKGRSRNNVAVVVNKTVKER